MLKVSSVLPFKHLIAADLNRPLAAAATKSAATTATAAHGSTSTSTVGDSPLSHPDRLGYFDMCLCVGTTEFVHDHGFLLGQVRALLRRGGLFCGTFPSNRSATYPDMSFTSVEQLARNVAREGGMDLLEVQQYRGWSVSKEEHVEYIQVLAQKRR